MRHLGRLLVTAVLLAVPRALRAVLGTIRPRAAYVELAATDPTLAAFVTALQTEIDRHAHRPLASAHTPTHVAVHGLVRLETSTGRRQAVTVSVRRGGRVHPLVIEGTALDTRATARTLLAEVERLESASLAS